MAETWDSNYEAQPGPDDSPSLGWDEFNKLKEGVRTRFQNEHRFDLTTPATTAQGWHKQGSALLYYGTTAPTKRPDDVTDFTEADLGRLWYDTANEAINILTNHDPVTWDAITQKKFALYAGTEVPSDSLGEDGDFYFQYED